MAITQRDNEDDEEFADEEEFGMKSDESFPLPDCIQGTIASCRR
jgi:hypothetical protein